MPHKGGPSRKKTSGAESEEPCFSQYSVIMLYKRVFYFKLQLVKLGVDAPRNNFPLMRQLMGSMLVAHECEYSFAVKNTPP